MKRLTFDEWFKWMTTPRQTMSEHGWLCPHEGHSTGDCGPMCECTERIRDGTYAVVIDAATVGQEQK